MSLHPILIDNLRPFQLEGIEALYNYFDTTDGNPVLAYPTGCHAKGTEILMYNGSVKLVEDVLPGDKLMGPDSKPRTVLNLARGNEQMVRIIPTKGETFVVNLGHILSLYKTREGKIKDYGFEATSIDNVPVEMYMLSSKWFKHIHKLRRVGVEFPNKSFLPLHPYFMGLFLGDGGYSHSSVNFTSMDEILMNYVKEIAYGLGDKILVREKPNNKACTINFTTTIRNRTRRTKMAWHLDQLGLRGVNSGTKFIPNCYKATTRENRLQLLAGLMDTDGHLCWSGSYDYVSKSKQLAKDVTFVARSLGFAAYLKSCVKASQHGTKGTYFRVSISGNVEEIPCKLKYKQAPERKQIKNVLVTGFKTEILPPDNFYGFALDSDHLYLTSDFIVHHNTGKSYVNAGIAIDVLMKWPNQRILMLTHVKNLIEQNLEKLLKLWPNAPVGIYSAGLNQRDTAHPLIFGGVASVVNNVEAFGHRDLIIIDEAHLVSPDENTMYRTIISKLIEINPFLKVIGLSATPYRIGQGLITEEGGIFNDICYDLTGIQPFNRFIAEGYLAPLIPKRTNVEIDVSGIKIMNGDFAKSKLDDATEKVIFEALKEAMYYGQGRNCWLVFCSGIKPSEHAASILQSFGIAAAAVHSKLTDVECDKRFEAFKRGEIKALVGNNKFTTGFDFAPIDFCIMLRSTMSPGLWVQMLGRLTRPYDFTNAQQYIAGFEYIKHNGLVLDFAGNTKRLGPINSPTIPRKKGTAVGDAPIKICEAVIDGQVCGVYNYAGARTCCSCGSEFEFQVKLKTTAGTDILIAGDEPTIETFEVTRVIYHKHNKIGSQPSMKVSYYCGLQKFSEYVCLQHVGMAKTRAKSWWMQRHASPPPETVDEALLYSSQLRMPKRISVVVSGKFPEIKFVEW